MRLGQAVDPPFEEVAALAGDENCSLAGGVGSFQITSGPGDRNVLGRQELPQPVELAPVVGAGLPRHEGSAGVESAIGLGGQHGEVGHRGVTHGSKPGGPRCVQGASGIIASEELSEEVVWVESGQEAAARVGVHVDPRSSGQGHGETLRRPVARLGNVEPMGATYRLAQLGIELPPVMAPAGSYRSCVVVGSAVHVGGHGPVNGPEMVCGKVGLDLDIVQARRAARMTGLSILASLRQELGDLDRVRRIVKVFGMVNAAPGFDQMPAVIDGCSDLLIEVFGEAGRHTRSAVGMAELPFGIAVEIELMAEID